MNYGTAAAPAGQALAEVERFLTQALPPAAVAHSYHVDALANPALQADPTFQLFSLIELNELHHQIASLGSLLRLQAGDRTALGSLGYNLAGFVQNRQAALQVARNFAPGVLANPAVQQFLPLVAQSNRQIDRFSPALSQVLALSGVGAPGPLLVGAPA